MYGPGRGLGRGPPGLGASGRFVYCEGRGRGDGVDGGNLSRLPEDPDGRIRGPRGDGLMPPGIPIIPGDEGKPFKDAEGDEVL